MNMIRSICVYCGSSNGLGETYVEAGHVLGHTIADAGLRLVYGGGNKGIMGAVAKGTADHGGKVLGIIPSFLLNREASTAAIEQLDDVIVTENMHQRKHAMFEESDAFVAMPGGIGTLEEVVEIMTWAQLGRHRKPIVFANINGFWNPMLTLLDHMRDQGFVHTSHLVQPLIVDTAEAIVPAILTAVAAEGQSTEGNAKVIDRL